MVTRKQKKELNMREAFIKLAVRRGWEARRKKCVAIDNTRQNEKIHRDFYIITNE